MTDTVNRGKVFEKQVQQSLEKENVFVLRLYDTMGGYSNIANPCDYIVYTYPTLLLLECKSCHGISFSVNNITDNQWSCLLDADTINGIKAGYMIWFIDKDVTVFISATQLNEYLHQTNKKSISFENAQSIGFIITGQKKKVYFDYDMKEFTKYVSKY